MNSEVNKAAVVRVVFCMSIFIAHAAAGADSSGDRPSVSSTIAGERISPEAQAQADAIAKRKMAEMEAKEKARAEKNAKKREERKAKSKAENEARAKAQKEAEAQRKAEEARRAAREKAAIDQCERRHKEGC